MNGHPAPPLFLKRGCHVSTQTPSVKVLPNKIRNNLIHRYLLAVETPEQADMIIPSPVYKAEFKVNPLKFPIGEGIYKNANREAFMFKVPYLNDNLQKPEKVL